MASGGSGTWRVALWRRAAALSCICLAVPSCVDRSTQRRLAVLTARVDSLSASVKALRGQPARPRQSAADTATVDIQGAGSIGSRDAPVVIVEFTDYQCPWCGQHFRTTMPRIRRDLVDKGIVMYVVRDLPIPMHPNAFAAAKAARCVREQSDTSFWVFHDSLFSAQPRLADSTVDKLVQALPVDYRRFKRCIGQKATIAAVQQDMKVAEEIGITATPGFIVGPNKASGRITGRTLRGAVPFEEFQTAVVAAQAKVKQADGPKRRLEDSSPLRRRDK